MIHRNESSQEGTCHNDAFPHCGGDHTRLRPPFTEPLDRLTVCETGRMLSWRTQRVALCEFWPGWNARPVQDNASSLALENKGEGRGLQTSASLRARNVECKSARGSGADRHRKYVSRLQSEGSRKGAECQNDEVVCYACQHAASGWLDLPRTDMLAVRKLIIKSPF